MVPLVHGCIFTRGSKDLHRTAVFVGGSDVAAAEAVLAEVRKHLIPQYGMSVSLMLDPNGANTTAAAAVRAAGRHLDLGTARSLVLGGTGPVGQRVARLLAAAGGHVRIGSRDRGRAEQMRMRRDGVPVLGFTWYSLIDQVDWDTELAEKNGRVFACGLYDLDRKPRQVEADFRAMVQEFGRISLMPHGEMLDLTARPAELKVEV